MAELSISVSGMAGRFDSADLVSTMNRVPGVTSASMGAGKGLVITYDPRQTDTFELVSAVHGAGYAILTETVTLPVGGMSCAGCALHVETALTDQPGVVTAEVDLQKGVSHITVVAGSLSLATLVRAIHEAGYEVLASA